MRVLMTCPKECKCMVSPDNKLYVIAKQDIDAHTKFGRYLGKLKSDIKDNMYCWTVNLLKVLRLSNVKKKLKEIIFTSRH